MFESSAGGVSAVLAAATSHQPLDMATGHRGRCKNLAPLAIFVIFLGLIWGSVGSKYIEPQTGQNLAVLN